MTLAPDGVETEVAVVREDASGALVELPRLHAANGFASRSAVAFDASGRLHVAWTERAEDDREVFAAVLEGGAWANVTQLSGGLGYAGFPSLAADASGALHVAWYGFDGETYQAFYRRMAPNGSWEPSVQLSFGSLDANNPNVLVDREGRAHVVWYKADGNQYRIWHAVRHPDGSFDLPGAVPVPTAEDVDAFNAAMALDAAGVVHVVWDEKHADGYWIAHAVWRPESGWATPEVLARGAEGGEYPAMAAWRDGVLVSWTNATGALVGTDLSGAPRPLLGGVEGRNPSLRGPRLLPASDAAEVLDVLFAQRQAEGDWHVAHVAMPSSCDPFAPLAACSEARVVEVEVAPREVAQPVATPGAWVVLALVAASVVAFTRRRS